MKKIFMTLVAATLCLIPQIANASYYTGACGESATYSFDTSTGLLYIGGEGAMKTYSGSDPAPWWDWTDQVKHILIEEGITEIGSFSGLYSIEELTMPRSLRVIRPSSFSYTYIGEVNIPEGVTTIGAEAFSHSNCSVVRIPSTVTEIGSGAFAQNGKPEIYAYWTNASDIVNLSAMEDWSLPFGTTAEVRSMTLHVVNGLKAAYESMDYWKEFGSILDDIYLPDLYIGGERVKLSDIDEQNVVHSPAIAAGTVTYRRLGSAAVITLTGAEIKQPVTITAEFAAIIIENDCRIVVPSGNALTFAGENQSFEINNGDGMYFFAGDQLILHTDGNGAALAVKANKKNNAAISNGYKVIQHKKLSDSGQEHGSLRLVLESAQGTGIMIEGANEGCDGAIIDLSTRDEEAPFCFYAAGKNAAHDPDVSFSTNNNIIKLREGEEAGLQFVEYRPQSAQGVEEVPSDQVHCTKLLRNGVLLIRVGGEEYNAQGQRMR